MSVPAAPSDLAGLRVLLVEDESFVALLLEDMLADLGCEVSATTGQLATALELARRSEIDLAVLDVNLAGERSDQVARLLAGRRVPFLFVTGYGRAGVAPEWRDRPVLEKPFADAALARALRQAIAHAAG